MWMSAPSKCQQADNFRTRTTVFGFTTASGWLGGGGGTMTVVNINIRHQNSVKFYGSGAKNMLLDDLER